MTHQDIEKDIDCLISDLDNMHIYDPHLISISDEDFTKMLEKDFEEFIIDINSSYEVQEEITETC